jgi:hypothetical protein
MCDTYLERFIRVLQTAVQAKGLTVEYTRGNLNRTSELANGAFPTIDFQILGQNTNIVGTITQTSVNLWRFKIEARTPSEVIVQLTPSRRTGDYEITSTNLPNIGRLTLNQRLENVDVLLNVLTRLDEAQNTPESSIA